MRRKSTIAVAVPTYARPDLLTQLIRSIPCWIDIFVSDNNHSLSISESELGENVAVSHSATLIPMFENWNRALSLVPANATHVLVPSDDDLYLPGAFDCALQAISEHADADIFIFGCDLIDERGNITAGYIPLRHEFLEVGRGIYRFLHGVDARMPGVMFKKEFLDRIGSFDENFQLTAADSELVQRALILGRSAFIPQIVGLYRVWTGSLTHSRQATAQWMREIEEWTGGITRLLESKSTESIPSINFRRFKDEIFARNLLCGLRGLISRHQYLAARDFLRMNRYPHAATARTKAALAHCYSKLLIRGLP